jgi:MFS transporter, PAT family, beta-lactamase induction signal transducer AmpG
MVWSHLISHDIPTISRRDDVSAGGRRLPVWLLGLCNFPLGAYFAVMLLTVPQMLAAAGVPEPKIASVTAIGLIPSFCSFFLSPILDWRFTRRTYAVVLAFLTASALVAALTELRELTLLTAFMFVGTATVNLYQAALGGWLGSVVFPEEKGRLGAWFTVGNVAGGGLTASIAIVVLRRLPFELGVALLGLLLLAPLLSFCGSRRQQRTATCQLERLALCSH